MDTYAFSKVRLFILIELRLGDNNILGIKIVC